MGLNKLFGNSSFVTPLLSFIIAMYAARQLFGFYLLDMFGVEVETIVGVIIC
jgi:hypothetical protein